MAAKKNLEEQAAKIGEGTDPKPKSAAKSYSTRARKEKQQAPAEPNEPPETTNNDDERKTRQLVSAYVDRDVWRDIRMLAQYRAARGKQNHLKQPMSAGRLVEEALRMYLDANRAELDRWYAFISE